MTLHDELMAVIATAITQHPRSLQVHIGPSEIGITCERRLGYKVLCAPEREQTPAWRPTVGTATHNWLQDAFTEHAEPGRFLLENRVTVGNIAILGDISGSTDLFDTLTGTVVDWKIPSATTIKHARQHGPSGQYRTQAHLYGQGWINAGYQVNHVAICYLPASGELTDGYWWTEPFDPDIAARALARLERITIAAHALGDARQLRTADAHCEFCPYRAPDLCDGDPAYRPRTPKKPTLTPLRKKDN